MHKLTPSGTLQRVVYDRGTSFLRKTLAVVTNSTFSIIARLHWSRGNLRVRNEIATSDYRPPRNDSRTVAVLLAMTRFSSSDPIAMKCHAALSQVWMIWSDTVLFVIIMGNGANNSLWKYIIEIYKWFGEGSFIKLLFMSELRRFSCFVLPRRKTFVLNSCVVKEIGVIFRNPCHDTRV